MIYYAEALEDGRPQLGDDLAMRSHADVPMGAMWTFAPEEGPRPTYVADLKGAASVAHVYGKDWTGSEAFTSFGSPWSWSPQTLKHIADLQLSLGVTRSASTPPRTSRSSAPPPGIALAPFLGQAFTRDRDVGGRGRAVDRLPRAVQRRAERGRAGRRHRGLRRRGGAGDRAVRARARPTGARGFDFDYVGADALADILRVEDGRLVAAGARYRLLYLGGSSRRMTLAALAPRRDDCSTPERRWSASGPKRRPRSPTIRRSSSARAIASGLRVGSSRRMSRPRSTDSACGPRSRSTEGRSGGSHESSTTDASRSWRIRRASELHLRVTAADGGRLEGWDPVAVRRFALELSPEARWRRAPIVTLAPFGSLFLVTASTPAGTRDRGSGRGIPLDGEWRVQVPGGDPISTSPHPRRWTESGEVRARLLGDRCVPPRVHARRGRCGRGRACCSHSTEVGDIARVVLNGHDCGVVWTPPFRLDVSGAARAGRTASSVARRDAVAQPPDREAERATGEIFAPMTEVYEPQRVPSPAGLDGPVRLIVMH